MGKGIVPLKLAWNRRRWRVGLTVGSMAVALAGALAVAGHRSEAAQLVHPRPPSPCRRIRRPDAGPEHALPQAALALVQGERDKYWLNAKEVTVRSVPELFAQHQDELTRGLRLSKILQGDHAKERDRADV